MPFPVSHNQGSPIVELEIPGTCDYSIQKCQLTLTRGNSFFGIPLIPLAVTACQGYRRDNRTEVRSEIGGVNYRRGIRKESCSIK